jgi:hypothetical protein
MKKTKKGLRAKLDFSFDFDEEVPELNYEIPLKKKKRINKKNKIKRTKFKDDPNVKLF